MKIRPAEPEDIPELVHLNKLDITRWRHFRENIGFTEECSWDDLTPFERYMYGGPWFDPQLFKVQLKAYDLCEGTILVAEEKGTIVGEADLIISNEPTPYYRNLGLIWILVAPSHRRKHIATALMQKSIQYGKQNNCIHYFTWPEDERSHNLYLNMGFQKVWNLEYYRGKPRRPYIIRDAEIEERSLVDYPKELIQVINRHNPAAYSWAQFIVHEEMQKIMRTFMQKDVFTANIKGKKSVFSVGTQPCIWVEPDSRQDFELIKSILTVVIHQLSIKTSEIHLYIQKHQREITEHFDLQNISKEGRVYLKMNVKRKNNNLF